MNLTGLHRLDRPLVTFLITFTTGERIEVQAFCYVLVCGKRKFYGIFERSELQALMDGLVLSFARFGGCAQHCKCDSQKPVVQRWEGHQPIYNLRFLAFATYYEFRPMAVLGNPNAKPRVERSFWEVALFEARPVVVLSVPVGAARKGRPYRDRCSDIRIAAVERRAAAAGGLLRPSFDGRKPCAS